MRALLVVVLLTLASVGPAVAADAAKRPSPAPRPARAAPGAKRAADDPLRGRSPSRVLDDVHIEGEIPMPQVLFITARDQRRFMDFAHRRYLRTSRELAERTVPPTWTVVTSDVPSDARKEKTP